MAADLLLGNALGGDEAIADAAGLVTVSGTDVGTEAGWELAAEFYSVIAKADTTIGLFDLFNHCPQW